jgi:integrase
LGGQQGVRTEELARLRFAKGNIDIDAGLVRVPKSAAKKRRARIVVMESGLQRLLKALRDRPRVRLKHVRKLPRPTDEDSRVFSPKLLAAFKEALRKPIIEGGAGFPILDEGGQRHVGKNGKLTVTGQSAWRGNGLRAAFATYHCERGKEAKVTAGQMGHTGSLDVFFNYYFGLAEQGEGAAFFAIPDEVISLLSLKSPGSFS